MPQPCLRQSSPGSTNPQTKGSQKEACSFKKTEKPGQTSMYGSSVNFSFIPERADWTYCSNLDSIIMLIQL